MADDKKLELKLGPLTIRTDRGLLDALVPALAARGLVEGAVPQERTANVEAIVRRVEQLRAEGPALAEQPGPSKRWMSRWTRDAEDAFEDAVRELYARVLFGEATAPGSCSLRTLGVLRELDDPAARTFEQLLPFVFDDDRLLASAPGAGELVDAGLVEAGEADHALTTLRLRGGGALSLGEPSRRSVRRLTAAGRELSRSWPTPPTQDEVIALAREATPADGRARVVLAVDGEVHDLTDRVIASR